MDEIVVDPGSSAAQFSIMQSQQPPQHGPEVRLTAAGVPRKKPGRKPKPKEPADENSTATEQQPKQRRPRKPKDPNAPPIQRKRKAAATDTPDLADAHDHDTSMEIDTSLASANRYSLGGPSKLEAPIISLDQRAPKIPKRETHPVSMSHLLNDEAPPSKPPPRQVFDPIRGSYDPVRETMVSRDVFGTASIMGSPRAPTSQPVNRASASPSIASLVDPPTVSHNISPVPSHQTPYNTTTTKSRLQESTSATPASSNPVRSTPQQITKPTIIEVRRAPPPPPAPAASQRKPSPPKNSFTSMATVPPTSSAAAATKAATETPSTIPPPTNNKKLTALVQQERESTNPRGNKTGSNHSSEAVNNKRDGGSNSLKDALLPPLPSVGGGGTERSILDFGKVNPGQEIEAPSIKIHIPLNGETNKYVNFMRMAEEQYGWDALHPRQAANRERKARIAAATAALEKSVGASGRESGEEMDEDIQSDAENSNIEMGGTNALTNGAAAASGPETAPAKPARKKRNFKEDEYDIDDDFVDDSEMLWEAQAAASRDGFFVYSGPLIPEVPKPEVAPPARRGRGGGRGSRGGRGGTTRGGANAAGHGADGTATEKPSGRGRGGGPGSRGGRGGGGDGTRKPRITKLEKEQRERERAERERLATITAMAKAMSPGAAGSAYGLLGLTSPSPGAAAAAGGGGLPTAMMID
ncbi:hypothetical protein B0T20DRAFT_96857 [Sordaria brevicollis]|uniref:Hpc2-related domain-containing protein n=1 Tax=Sordaria brevicollis TaxID=83679 RepID=A0AAE0U2L1_SORBR|nr:hypothetical protein B0T20DRAFT_96857 [Sordaria brevicollis]